MSKIDVLHETYCLAVKAYMNSNGGALIWDAERAGIRAVVKALRDECDRVLPCDRKFSRNQVWDVFNEILGAAGDEVAGVARADDLGIEVTGGVRRETDKQIPEQPEADIYDPSAPATAPATAPAPAVCVWTDVGDAYRSACGRSHFAWTSRDGVVVCPHCKAPIKFTEAQR